MPKAGKKNRYLLLDGNALVHRGFHAIPVLTTKEGEPTNAVYGFTMILLRAIKDLKPTHIACSFDLKAPTFRHEEYVDYKAHRAAAPDELYAQFDRVKEVVRALNIPIFEIEGFEADDVLGTLATEICKHNKDACEVLIATGDLDTLQLVNKCVKIYTSRKGLTDIAIYDEAAIKERYGLVPLQMIDYKALRGDPSDNIKGVKGIGEKTASELIKEFGSIDDLYKAIKNDKNIEKKIKARPLALLTEGEADARLSYKLSQIITNVPIKVEVPAYEFGSKQLDTVVKLFKDLEFRTLLDKLPKNYAVLNEEVEPVAKEVNEDIGKQNYILIDSQDKLKTLLVKLARQKEVAIDTETDQLNPVDAQVIGISLCFKSGEAYYITRDVVDESSELKKLIGDSKLKKVGQNMKYDLLTLQNMDVEFSPLSFDTMLASYLLNAGTRQHSLDAMAFTMFGYQMQSITELIGKGKKQISMKDVPIEKVSWYAAEDADMTWRIKELLDKDLTGELRKVFENIEMPLIPALARMERCGIKVDAKLLSELSKEAVKELDKLEKKIYKHAGQEFNINSPKQLQEILFDKLGLTGGKKNKSGGLSTAAGELDKMRLEHEIVDDILKYRELAKLQSTYLETLPELINKRTGRIHTSYNQTIAATGRLSSTDPNLQNIPIKGDGLGSRVREAFVAEKGYKLVSLDYSQIELRVVAHLSGDKAMQKIFAAGEDIHTGTAMAVFDVKEDKVTPDMRRYAKTINFGILYGLSSFGFADRVHSVSQAEAKDFIEKYFATFPEVNTYLEKVKMQVREDAFVTNELGRMRKFPEIKSSQYFIRQAAERAAINFPIQGLSADMMKLAMLDIDKEILGKDDEVRMLLQVHDELVFEIKADSVDKWVKKLKPLMENAYKLKVPVVVEAKVGDNWSQMEKI